VRHANLYFTASCCSQVSRYGFVRGGSPWLNYSVDGDVSLNSSNDHMWKSNHGNFAGCEKSLPQQPPPWADAAKWAACRAVLARGGGPKKRAKTDCCYCKSIADVVDSDHDEQGFATGGTLRRLEHVAASAGVDTRQLWQSVDDVLLREMATEQKHFQRNAAAAKHRGLRNSQKSQQFTDQLSRWATPFTADVGFAADGRAYLFETLLQPSWKGPGFQWTEAADREKLGIYSSLMLAMAPMMLHPAADEHHKRLLAPLNLPTSAQEETRFFLHTQGLASTLGFRRAWPAPPRFAAQEPLTGILDERDERFAAMLHAQGLLLPGMQGHSDSAQPDLWGGPTSNPAARTAPRWPVGNGTLYSQPNPKFSTRGTKCVETPRIVQEWHRTRSARE
tara:strand:+ start:1447 stop:2619 length:1173 start_codon:yes stop_codon:yes gene_type:complete